jgi:hypothetical protein
MSHFLARLIEKQQVPESAIQPRLPARFEQFSAAENPEEADFVQPISKSRPESRLEQIEERTHESEKGPVATEIPLREIIREQQTSIQQLHILQPRENETANSMPMQPQVIIQRLMTDKEHMQPYHQEIPQTQIVALPLTDSQETAVPQTILLPSPHPEAIAVLPKVKKERMQETAVVQPAKSDASNTPSPLLVPKPQSDLPVSNQISPSPQPNKNHFQQQKNIFAKQKFVAEKDQSNAATTIQVTIGRVEVRATPAAQPSKRPQKATNIMSLDDYLQQRGGKS